MKRRDINYLIYSHADSYKNILLRKSTAKKSRDINYIIEENSYKDRCKYTSFLEKVKTEKEPRYKYMIKSYAQRDLSNNFFVGKIKTDEKTRYKLCN